MELVAVETETAEALLFSRTAPISGSLWAWWFAAMAAAVGLWRFRSAAIVAKPAAVAAIDAGDSAPAPTRPNAAVLASRTGDLALPPSRPAAARFRLDEDCYCSPKGRFTAYYFHDEAGGEEDAGRYEDDAAAEEEALGDGINWPDEEGKEEEEATEEVKSRRNVALGWYMYQDRSALNGSVVKLWGGDLRLTAVAAAAAAAVGTTTTFGRRPAENIVLGGKTGMGF